MRVQNALWAVERDRIAIARQLEEHGFVLLPEWKPNTASSEIIHYFGRPLSFGTRLVHEIRPQRKSTPNTYSGAYGLGEFPLHTDMAQWPAPPRYLFLRCVVGHQSVYTTLVDGREIVQGIATELARALVRPRRPLRGVVPLLHLLRPTKDREMLLRWDERYIVPASAAGGVGMHMIRQRLAAAGVKAVQLWQAGDTLLVDNWRMLHGRSKVPEEHTDRLIDRAYFGEVF